MWTLTKGPHRLRCVVCSHPRGWELRTVTRTALKRSHVTKSQSEVRNLAEAWKAEAAQEGWSQGMAWNIKALARVVRALRGSSRSNVFMNIWNRRGDSRAR